MFPFVGWCFQYIFICLSKKNVLKKKVEVWMCLASHMLISQVLSLMEDLPMGILLL